jgi:nicotinamidase-related amidase
MPVRFPAGRGGLGTRSGRRTGYYTEPVEKAFGLEIPESLAEACDPRRLAVIVYDMQVGITSQLEAAASVTGGVLAALEAARSAGVRVFFTRHMSLPLELAGVFQLRQSMAWQKVSRATDVRPRFLRGAPGFELLPELAPRSSEAIFDKITFSAFEGTPLDIALRDCAVNAFAICGIATEIGIEPTVRHGADLGYIPIVITDACGAGSVEAGRRALETIEFMGDGFLTDVATFGHVLGRQARMG